VIEAANNAVIGFLATWRNAWHSSSQLSGYANDDVRMRDVHCHWDGSFKVGTSQAYPPGVIHHGSRRSMCPNWYPTEEGEKPDERVDRDGALDPALRDRVRQARASLIESLAALAERAPNDPWITGQRVRFLVDQGEPKEAAELARRCSAGAAWCAQLLGYALHSAGNYRGADSAFDAATAAMTPKDKCAWTNTQALLDGDGRSRYGRMNCEERLAANKKIWWMSTPMYSDSANDRRSEDYARRVLIQLHAALNWDERYDWRPRYGGEAVAEMLVRYGWPAFSAYGGDYEERSHASWMSFYDSTRTATAEYPQDRIHLVPQWSAVTDPFHAPASAWQLNMPPVDESAASQWWPNEHYAPGRGHIAQLADQTVMLRRDDDVMLVTASELRFNRKPMKADISAAALVRTTSPDSVERLKRHAVRNATSLVLMARIPTGPAVVGTEVLAPRGETSLRTRFGITAPATLSALKPGEAAISDPVLLGVTETANGAESALDQMLGSTVVRANKVGLYWETYGYGPGDSVDVAFIITRTEKQSVFRKIGMKLRMAKDINGSVAVRWSEPQAGHDSWTIPSKVPIQARVVTLDLSQLEPGHYSVQVQAGKKGAVLPVLTKKGEPIPAPPLTASRSFILERP
jgi:tetratricopeptide (TPR) repeat protein